MVLKNSIYCCTGNISEWSKCINTVKTPKRVAAQIPDKYRIFLRGTFKIRTRILIDVPTIADEDYAYVVLKSNISTLTIYIFTILLILYRLHVKQPLFDMEFMIVGETSRPKSEIENRIKQMGGKLCMQFHQTLSAIISNAEEITKMEPIMKDAKTYGIHIVPETFIDEVKNSDPLQLITKLDLSGWGKNV